MPRYQDRLLVKDYMTSIKSIHMIGVIEQDMVYGRSFVAHLVR